jgi:hypothetical protein
MRKLSNVSCFIVFAIAADESTLKYWLLNARVKEWLVGIIPGPRERLYEANGPVVMQLPPVASEFVRFLNAPA